MLSLRKCKITVLDCRENLTSLKVQMQGRRSCQRWRLDDVNLSLPSPINMYMLTIRVKINIILLLSMVWVQKFGNNLQNTDKPLIGRFDATMFFFKFYIH